MLIKFPKRPLNLLASNNGFLSGFMFSLHGKAKMVAPALKYESNRTENYIFVNHLSRPFVWESLKNFIFSRPNDDS